MHFKRKFVSVLRLLMCSINELNENTFENDIFVKVNETITRGHGMRTPEETLMKRRSR